MFWKATGAYIGDAGNAVAPGMEQEQFPFAEDADGQVHDLLDCFLLQGEVPAGDVSDDADGDGLVVLLIGFLRNDGFPVVVDDPAVRQRVQHPLYRHVRDPRSGGDLPEGRRPVVVPVKVVDEGDDPVHLFGIPVFHSVSPLAFRKWYS